MVRPKKIKMVEYEPDVTYFKPRAVPLTELEESELTVCELEALRLSNIEKLSQTDAAKRMDVHQSTFQRTLARATEIVTDALVNGKAIKIKGGDYKMPGKDQTGPAGRGRGLRGRGLGLGGVCVCPKCGYQAPHSRGLPCNQQKCPECNSMMTRK